MNYLLDANVLIALSCPDHADWRRSTTWINGVSSFALCPITEGALVRFLVRVGQKVPVVQAQLQAIAKHPGYEFWPNDLSYAQADLSAVTGHKQVTDAYLVALANHHKDAKLATMDVALSLAYPNVVELIA